MSYSQRIPQRFDDAAPRIVRVPLARMDDGRPLDAGTMECLANNAAHLGRENSRRVLFVAASPLAEANKWISQLAGAGPWTGPSAPQTINLPPYFQPWGLGMNAVAAEYAPTCDAFDAAQPAMPFTRRVRVTVKATTTGNVYAHVVLTPGWGSPRSSPGALLTYTGDYMPIGAGLTSTFELDRVSLPPSASWRTPRVTDAAGVQWPHLVLWVGFAGDPLSTLAVDSISAVELRDPDASP